MRSSVIRSVVEVCVLITEERRKSRRQAKKSRILASNGVCLNEHNETSVIQLQHI